MGFQQPQPKTSLAHQAPHVAQHRDGAIQVRALKRGYYGYKLRERGEQFGISDLKELGSWMELVKADETSEGEAPPVTPPQKPNDPAGAKKDEKKDGKKDGKKSENDVL